MVPEQILSISFLVAILAAGIRLAIPILLAVIGEIITEKGGILNLGLEGMMLMGAMTGFAVTWYLENNLIFSIGPTGAAWLGLLAGAGVGLLMGLVMAILSITLKADQVISSIMLVLLGYGLSSYIFRQQFEALAPRVTGFEPIHIPVLSDIPILGPILSTQNVTFYLTILIVFGSWFLLNRMTLGLNIRAMGENPSAGETSGLSVSKVRYSATLIGASLAGLGGAVLTVAQLHVFREGITAGRGWIAIALVIFGQWKPSLAVVGALLFGIADAIQFRIQTLGSENIPYEVLLMLPYLLTIFILFRGTRKTEQPETLGKPYIRGAR
ncbi:MAG: ABC transporter permease [Chloroflexota bacterium]|nr:MAG: ABC transporter permease [Chloroflexota bacterium]